MGPHLSSPWETWEMAEYESFSKQDVADISGTIQLLPQNLFWLEFALP